MPVDPEHPSGLRVEGDHVIRPLGEVHDAVDDERRHLPAAGDRGLVHPFHLEVLDVRRRDLRETAVPVAEVAAGVDQPVPRFLCGVEQTVGADLAGSAVALERKGPTFARQRLAELRLGKREGRREPRFSLRPLRPLRSS